MKKGERKYPCNCGDGGCWKCCPSNFTTKALREEKREEDARLKAAASQKGEEGK